jgi:hypothetical protein
MSVKAPWAINRNRFLGSEIMAFWLIAQWGIIQIAHGRLTGTPMGNLPESIGLLSKFEIVTYEMVPQSIFSMILECVIWDMHVRTHSMQFTRQKTIACTLLSPCLKNL